MIINNRITPSIQQVQNEYLKSQINKKSETQTTDFANILQQQVNSSEGLKFSKHASMRMSTRQIELSDDQMLRLTVGVSKAKAKGIKESLVLMDNIALVVNIENKTVVTALDQTEAREHIFTNIDGAVVL